MPLRASMCGVRSGHIRIIWFSTHLGDLWNYPLTTRDSPHEMCARFCFVVVIVYLSVDSYDLCSRISIMCNTVYLGSNVPPLIASSFAVKYGGKRSPLIELFRCWKIMKFPVCHKSGRDFLYQDYSFAIRSISVPKYFQVIIVCLHTVSCSLVTRFREPYPYVPAKDNFPPTQKSPTFLYTFSIGSYATQFGKFATNVVIAPVRFTFKMWVGKHFA